MTLGPMNMHVCLRNRRGPGSGIDTDAFLDQNLPIDKFKKQTIQLLGIFLKLSTRCLSTATGVFTYL